MKSLFTGTATALITPFDQNQKVDFVCLRKLINRQIAMHVKALVILGTTGEMTTLTHQERCAIIDCAIKTNRNRVPLIFGIGGNDPQRIIDLGNEVVKRTPLGAKIGIMVTAPYYNKGTQHSIISYFQKITAALKLPTIVYNIPGRTGVNITPETMAQIATLPNVFGIKEASGDLTQIIKTVQLCPQIPVYCGDDNLSLPCYAVGCQGIISVATNIDVAPVEKIFNLFQNGQIHAARELFQTQLPFYQSLFTVVNPIPVKSILAKLGIIKNVLRLPLEPIQ